MTDADLVFFLGDQARDAHCAPIAAAVALEDGGAVTGARDATLRVWSRSAECRGVLEGHTNWVNDLKRHAGSGTVFSASSDASVKVWRLRDRWEDSVVADKPVASLLGHSDYVERLAIADLPGLLVSAGLDSQIFVWELAALEKGIPIMKLNVKQQRTALSDRHHRPENLSYYALDAAKDGSLVAAGGTDGLIRIWDPRTSHRELFRLGRIAVGSTVKEIKFSSDRFSLFSGGSDSHSKMRRWDLRKIKDQSDVPAMEFIAQIWDISALPDQSSIWTFDLDEEKQKAFVGGRCPRIASINLLDGESQKLATLGPSNQSCLRIHKSEYADSELLVANGNSDLWIVDHNSLDMRAFSSGIPPIKKFKVLSDNLTVVTQDAAGQIQSWNALTGELSKSSPMTETWTEELESSSTKQSIPRWFTVDIHLGRVGIALKKNLCFSADVCLSVNDPIIRLLVDPIKNFPNAVTTTLVNLGEIRVNYGAFALKRVLSSWIDFHRLPNSIDSDHEPIARQEHLSTPSERNCQGFVVAKTNRGIQEVLNQYSANELDQLLPDWICKAIFVISAFIVNDCLFYLLT